MDSGVVYAAWLAGRWQLIAMDRPRRAARLSIERKVWLRAVALAAVRVGWSDSFTESGRQRWRTTIPSGAPRMLGSGVRGTDSVGACGRE